VSEPRRLLAEGATDFERRLLRAVAGERPSARQRARMLHGIGISSGLALWAATAQAVVATAGGQLALGLAAAGVVGVAALPLMHVEPPSDSPVVITAPVAAAPVAAAPGIPAVRSAELQPVSHDVVTAPAPAVDAANDLRAQIELLDRVKGALDHQDLAGASALLDRFEREFPEGVLLREARTLRRSAHKTARRGDRDAASRSVY
jgi:hypothetical protein